MRNQLSRALIAEFIGTFALIFVGAGTSALGIGGLVGVALAHGLMVAVFAYAYGHISGAHINPAVTVGLWIAGKVHAGKAMSYLVFQTLGGIAGALLLRVVLGGADTGLGVTVLATDLSVGGVTITIEPMVGLLIEAILTFLLVNIFLSAAVGGHGGENAGLAIGLTYAAAILMGGPLTGGSLNPARTLGPAVATGSFENLWVYFAGPVLGAVVAGVLFRGALED